jgi:phosphodiesterase/alkaline phosphatase D-like protein
LLELIFDDGTGNLVFLCGDYHIYADCQFTLTSTEDKSRRVTSRCVTTSGVYCPYDFANTDKPELMRFVTGSCARFDWACEMTDCRTGSGYTVVDADATGRMSVRFVSSG